MLKKILFILFVVTTYSNAHNLDSAFTKEVAPNLKYNVEIGVGGYRESKFNVSFLTALNMEYKSYNLIFDYSGSPYSYNNFGVGASVLNTNDWLITILGLGYGNFGDNFMRFNAFLQFNTYIKLHKSENRTLKLLLSTKEIFMMNSHPRYLLFLGLSTNLF